MNKKRVLEAIDGCTYKSKIGLVINPYDLKLELGIER